MNVSVTYDDSDVATALDSIMDHHNTKEFVKLLTPMLCQSSQATTLFFKLMLGNKLPDIIPVGTLCKTHVNNLGYGSYKENIKNKYGDKDGNVIVRVGKHTIFYIRALFLFCFCVKEVIKFKTSRCWLSLLFNFYRSPKY